MPVRAQPDISTLGTALYLNIPVSGTAQYLQNNEYSLRKVLHYEHRVKLEFNASPSFSNRNYPIMLNP